MTIKMIYRNGKNYSIEFIEISDDEAEQWVTYDFEKRLSEAPDEEKSQICKRTPQEIADEFNRQEERFNKDEMRKRAKTVRTVKDKDGNSINSLDLTPDKDTLSPLEMFLNNEKSKQLQDAKELLYSHLTSTQIRRFEMKLSGMSLREIAEAEGVNFKSVNDSIEQVKVKINKIFSKNTPQNHL